MVLLKLKNGSARVELMVTHGRRVFDALLDKKQLAVGLLQQTRETRYDGR